MESCEDVSGKLVAIDCALWGHSIAMTMPLCEMEQGHIEENLFYMSYMFFIFYILSSILRLLQQHLLLDVYLCCHY